MSSQMTAVGSTDFNTPGAMEPNDRSMNRPDPMLMIVTAIEKDVSVEKLEKLLDLQERWEAAEGRKAYNRAFAQFQTTVPDIVRKKKGHNYMYAPLSDIAHQIRGTLMSCGLTYRFKVVDDGEVITVTCIVNHVDGHSEETTMSGSPDTSGSKNAIQARGSAVTYLQRYTLIGALGLTTADEDMDARVNTDTITPEQVADIESRLAMGKADTARFCKYMKVEQLADIRIADYGKADRALKDKEKANANS